MEDIIIDDVLVFAYCDDSEVEPDFAVAQLERIAASLLALAVDDRKLVVEKISRRSVDARLQGDFILAERLSALPGHLGIEE